MKYDEFIGQVQNRLELPDQGETVRAIRAVLATLGERLQGGEASDLAGSLPMEIDRYLTEAESSQSFEFAEFVDRVAEREGVERPDAQYHAQRIVQLVAEIVPGGEMNDVRSQLPDDFDPLFELHDAEGGG